MIAWFARNPVAANLLMISILMGGVLSLRTNIPLEVFPSFESDIISVDVSLRGATPEDVEQGVTIKVEEAVQDLEGIKKIVSNSREGSASIKIEVDSGYDPRDLLADIKSRVDAINTFSTDAEKPVIALAQRKREVLSVTLASNYGEKETRQFAEKVRDDLLALKEVTQLSLEAVRNYQININISQSTLKQYNLTLTEIAKAINDSSIDLSAGNIKTDGGDILIRSKGQAFQREEFENIIIKTNPDGTFLHLSDIARVDDGFEESPFKARFNGQQAVLIEIYRVGDQSAIEVANAVKNYIDRAQPTLPVGFSLSYWDDDSEIVKSRLKTLISNALQGSALVLLLLALFLRPSIAFWVFLGIPISFLGAFILMPFFGITINILSLFGFILVLGIVVDDAIVTGENIYRHSQTAESGLQAAIKGTEEVALPVTFGVLTTVAAFLPLGFIEGNRGALFAQIPVVVIPVLLFSLVESKFVLPAHLRHIRLRHEKTNKSAFEKWQEKFADGFEASILKYYQPLLKLAAAHRLSTIAIFVGILILIITIIISGWTRFVFFPRVPSETARVTLNMPIGTSFNVVDAEVEKMVAAAKTLQEKYRDEHGRSVILNTLSMTSNETGRVRFEILPANENNTGVGISQLVNEWRALIGPVAGAENIAFRAEIGRGGDPIDIELSGANMADLAGMAEQIKQKLARFPTVFEITDSLTSGKQEIQIEVNEQGYALGMNSGYITRQVRNAVFGTEIQRIQRGRDDIRVMLMLPQAERKSIAQLGDLLIETPSGDKVPLLHVADLKPGQSPSSIKRINRYRTVEISADVDKENTNMTVLNTEIKDYLNTLSGQYPGVRFSMEGEAKEQADSFGSLAIGLIFVFFIIYCLLAIPFKSYLQPLIVMSVIPFGVIGAVMGHWLMLMDLTIMSLLGLMALVGVVVNDSLVLVDFINKKRQAGLSLNEAVLTAGVSRFRPVLLTSLTTFIGLMPLLFERATQAQFLKPMAVSLSFGIIFATFITLILVPINYLVVEDIKKLFK